ncbi:beta-ketoacyl synthase N-terminal-like domain-containing protein [Streptomyces sp. NPDC002346]
MGSSYASVANRVSFVMNLHGPSMTVDTWSFVWYQVPPNDSADASGRFQ